MAAIVVVFDFDRTLIDGDSDSWVVTKMSLFDLFHQLRSTLPWNSFMDRMMNELHSRGETVDDIAECLKKTPVHPRIAAAIKAAHAFGCDLRILSDANQFFIEKILEHHDLLGCFSKINTNLTFVDEEGRLRIFPYHDSTLSPHGCSLCPSTLCKACSGLVYFFDCWIYCLWSPRFWVKYLTISKLLLLKAKGRILSTWEMGQAITAQL